MSLSTRVKKPRGRGGNVRNFSKSKPLGSNLQGNIVSSEAQKAELLKSKSNYELIVDGEISHAGLSFPNQTLEKIISKSVTTKRNDHADAERARRTALTTAIQELAGIISQDCCNEAFRNNYAIRCLTTGRDHTSSQIKSKVYTIEQAIDYIKCLQKEIEISKGGLEGHL